MQPGVQLAIAMWALTVLSGALVALRLYTRVHIVRFVGAEDYLYVATAVFFLVFTTAIQVAVHFGLGQNFWTLPLARSSDAIFWTYVANTFAITGNAMAKLCMGLFLLRVVQLRWHKIALWALVSVTAGTSTALTVMLWTQTTPAKTSWDPFRTPGRWNLKIQPMSVGLGVWSSLTDFFFAVFPWLFIWSLRMPRREKVMLAGSMSLGVIAGVCGIIRTVVLARLDVLNYTYTFVAYFAWAGAEIAVAMVCLGIPTLRPLYLRHRGLAVHSTHPSHPVDDVLPQFTMCDPEPLQQAAVQPVQQEAKDLEAAQSTPDHAPSNAPQSSPESSPESSPGSTSSQCEKFSSLDSLDSLDSLNSIAALPARPLRTYTSRGQDSVDEILGLYGHGSRGPSQSRSRGRGQIWVRNSVSVDQAASANWPLRS